LEKRGRNLQEPVKIKPQSTKNSQNGKWSKNTNQKIIKPQSIKEKRSDKIMRSPLINAYKVVRGSLISCIFMFKD